MAGAVSSPLLQPQPGLVGTRPGPALSPPRGPASCFVSVRGTAPGHRNRVTEEVKSTELGAALGPMAGLDQKPRLPSSEPPPRLPMIPPSAWHVANPQ